MSSNISYYKTKVKHFTCFRELSNVYNLACVFNLYRTGNIYHAIVNVSGKGFCRIAGARSLHQKAPSRILSINFTNVQIRCSESSYSRRTGDSAKTKVLLLIQLFGFGKFNFTKWFYQTIVNEYLFMNYYQTQSWLAGCESFP